MILAVLRSELQEHVKFNIAQHRQQLRSDINMVALRLTTSADERMVHLRKMRRIKLSESFDFVLA